MLNGDIGDPPRLWGTILRHVLPQGRVYLNSTKCAGGWYLKRLGRHNES